MTDLSAFSRQRIRCRIVMWQMVRGCGGNVPKYPKFCDVGVSRNAPQALRRDGDAGRREKTARALKFVRKQMQVFLKGADGYCACDCDVFDTADAICFARSKRKGEKECITKRDNRTFRRNWPTT
jgi:hypothetical protein